MPPISAVEDVNSGASSVYGQQQPTPNMGKELFVRLSSEAVQGVKAKREAANAAPHGAQSTTEADASAPASFAVGMPPDSALEGLSEESKECIERLASHKAAEEQDFGLARLAAVLIALYQRPGEETLRVLLTTRASHMRRNPGQTALPGGKIDPEDVSTVHAARREAYEEVGMPLDHPDIYTVAVLDPLITVLPLNAHMRNHIIVTPVVVFLSDSSLIATLQPNPDEVDYIFDHPLRAIHVGQPEGQVVDELVQRGDKWPLEDEFHSLEDRVGSTGAYRMHRFRTRHTPIRGFTSDVLIYTSSLAYGEEPSYGHFAPEQPKFAESIADIVQKLPAALAEPDGPKRPLEWGKSGGFVASGEKWAQH